MHTYIHTYVHAYIHRHADTHTHKHTRINKQKYTLIHTQTHAHSDIPTHSHTHTQTHTHTHTNKLAPTQDLTHAQARTGTLTGTHSHSRSCALARSQLHIRSVSIVAGSRTSCNGHCQRTVVTRAITSARLSGGHQTESWVSIGHEIRVMCRSPKLAVFSCEPAPTRRVRKSGRPRHPSPRSSELPRPRHSGPWNPNNFRRSLTPSPRTQESPALPLRLLAPGAPAPRMPGSGSDPMSRRPTARLRGARRRSSR